MDNKYITECGGGGGGVRNLSKSRSSNLGEGHEVKRRFENNRKRILEPRLTIVQNYETPAVDSIYGDPFGSGKIQERRGGESLKARKKPGPQSSEKPTLEGTTKF